MGNEIGSRLPRGVIDVEHDFVGVPKQVVNVKRELSRLSRQVASLRTRIETTGLSAPRENKATAAGIAITTLVVCGLGAAFLAMSPFRR